MENKYETIYLREQFLERMGTTVAIRTAILGGRLWITGSVDTSETTGYLNAEEVFYEEEERGI